MNTVCVVTITTESGDEYVVVFDKEYPDDQIEAYLNEQFPEEYEYVGFVNWDAWGKEPIITLESNNKKD